jgi:hypothetical protein
MEPHDILAIGMMSFIFFDRPALRDGLIRIGAALAGQLGARRLFKMLRQDPRVPLKVVQAAEALESLVVHSSALYLSRQYGFLSAETAQHGTRSTVIESATAAIWEGEKLYMSSMSLFHKAKFLYGIAKMAVMCSADYYFSSRTMAILRTVNLDDVPAAIQAFTDRIRRGDSFEVSWGNLLLTACGPSNPQRVTHEELDMICPLSYPAVDAALPPKDGCAICREQLPGQDLFRRLPCEHVFHAICVDQWLVERSATCPMCRRHVKAPQDTTRTNMPDTE